MILSRCIVACARGVLRAHYVTMVIGTWAFSMKHKMQNRFVKSIDVETEAVAEDIVRKVCGKDHKEVGLVGNLAKEGLRDVGLSQRWQLGSATKCWLCLGKTANRSLQSLGQQRTKQSV